MVLSTPSIVYVDGIETDSVAETPELEVSQRDRTVPLFQSKSSNPLLKKFPVATRDAPGTIVPKVVTGISFI
jgi:hypothetical protein